MAPEIVLSDNAASGLMKPPLSGNAANGLMKPAGGFQSRAYVTFLAGNGDYVKGVVGLTKGLRKVKTAYPLVVAVLPDVSEEHRQILESQGCIVKEIEPVYPRVRQTQFAMAYPLVVAVLPDVPEEHPQILESQDCIVKEIEPVYPPENQTQFAMAYHVINFSKLYSKLRIWKFDEYGKMIYLDADMQVYDNIDHLFDYPDGALYVASDCFCKDNKMMNPARNCQEELYFNAGMFIFEPSKKTCKDLLDILKLIPPTPFAMQDCLKRFFKDNYKLLSPIDDLNVAMLWSHPENAVDINRVKVVHYCAGVSKPWLYPTGKGENIKREDIKMLVKKWWDVYNDDSLDYKLPELDYKPSEPVSLQPLIRALSETGTVHYITTPSAA